MKNVLTMVLLAAVLAGCKKEEKVDNSATRYVGALQEDVVKAREAAEKANAAVAAEAARLQEAQAQSR